jgi:hypothetical protein
LTNLQRLADDRDRNVRALDGKKTLMVFGVGKLGGPVLDVLASKYPLHRFIIVSRDRERSDRRANLARYVSAQWAKFPEVIGERTDLLNVDETAALLDRYKPDLVLNATTPFPWWKISTLPRNESILCERAGPGMWCALDTLLPTRLSESLTQARSSATFINACYPDMTNVFLSGHASPPLAGVGNISNLVPGLQLAFADEVGCTPAEVLIQLVGHHYVSWNAPSSDGCSNAPYHLKVTYPHGELEFTGPDDTPFAILRRRAARVRNLEGLGVTIGSTATVLGTLLSGQERKHHCPGAIGMPGGYPVTISASGSVRLDLPESLTASAAAELNTAAQRLDGVEYVEAGRVETTDAGRDAFRVVTGMELPVVTPANMLEVSHQTISRLNHRYNLGLATL